MTNGTGRSLYPEKVEAGRELESKPGLVPESAARMLGAPSRRMIAQGRDMLKFAECGAFDPDTEGIVNLGIDTAGAEVSILAVERVGSTKFSLRTRERISAAQVAASMGGGGHARAAGVTLQLPLDEAVREVTAAFVKAVREG